MLKKLALVVALAAPACAFAGPYFVVGGALGKADLGDIESFYGPGTPLTTDDGFGRALIGVGADVSPNLGLEALYLTDAEGTVKDNTGQKDTLKSSGFQFAVIGKAPLTAQLSLFGKLSANYMDVQYEYADALAPGNNYSEKDSNFHLGFGAGALYQVSDAVGLRLGVERIQLRDAINGSGNFDVDQTSLAVTFAF